MYCSLSYISHAGCHPLLPSCGISNYCCFYAAIHKNIDIHNYWEY
jgi:hypothetical protein